MRGEEGLGGVGVRVGFDHYEGEIVVCGREARSPGLKQALERGPTELSILKRA